MAYNNTYNMTDDAVWINTIQLALMFIIIYLSVY